MAIASALAALTTVSSANAGQTSRAKIWLITASSHLFSEARVAEPDQVLGRCGLFARRLWATGQAWDAAADGQGRSDSEAKAYHRPRTIRRDDLHNSSFRLCG